MKRLVYLKLFFFSVLGALALSSISLFCLIRISDMVAGDYRYGYLLYIAKTIERSADFQPVNEINVSELPAPVPPKEDTLSLVKITEFGQASIQESRPLSKRLIPNFIRRDQTGSKPNLWLVSDSGKILSTNTLSLLPRKWPELLRPKKVHGIRSNDDFLLFKPKTYVVKLDTNPTTYLVSHNERSLFQGPFFWIQGMHTFVTAALSLFIALSLCAYYMRRKSREARKVLSRLASGDLKARFEVKRFDQFGNLIIDFNRMAEEIEHLVKRVHDTEASRSNLLQDLGHDLRTPLTSLSTAIDTLKHHNDNLTSEDRKELFVMLGEDIRYFTELLEKLTIVATIDEPNYKASTEKIDLSTLLQNEMKIRQTSTGEALNWILDLSDHDSEVILGDYHLITRLFKNALDNASRYARTNITVKLETIKDRIEVLIMDDGPGLTPDAIQSFGKRRERREIKVKKDSDSSHFSLGLGSVIMKTIAEAHGGSVEIGNHFAGRHVAGACLKVVLKV